MAWNDLTISQRSQLMNLFRRNGISSLSEMRRLYDLHSPSLVEATPSPYNPVAPVYDNGGYMPSEEIKNYIKGTEAFRSKWYKDANGNDTVGYGFTGKKVKELYPNGMTQEQADAYFDTLIPRYAQRMAQLTPNFDRLSQNQKDALFSYFYNIGEGSYSTGSPKMQQALRDFDLEAVLQNIDAGYNDSRNPGLRKRRDYERSLFERDMTYPLQPVPPAVQRGPLYAPEITRTVINVPWAETVQEKVKPFMYACGGNLFRRGGNTINVGPQILSKVLKDKYIKDYVNRGSVFGYPIRFKDWINYGLSPYTWRGGEADAIGKTRRALFGKYMGIEPKGITFSDYVEESPYRPSNETDSSSVYYRPKSNEGIDRQTMFEDVAGRLKMGHGVDENGKGYISYYDVWDLAPFSRGTGNEIKGSTPIELYDRFYEDEYPEMYERYMRSHGLWPQEIPDVNATVQKLSTLMKATGGKIYIKPSHRGRFTDLMSRTGHSASWFKAHGTPAQKKMAVFALNARKWKHSHGGFKF